MTKKGAGGYLPNAAALAWGAVGLALFFSLPILRGSDRPIDYGASLWRFMDRAFPPDVSVLPQAMEAMLQTIQMAVLATALAAALALPLALGSARNLSPVWVVGVVRFVLNAVRTVPSLIWAVVAVAMLGANPVAGVVALTFYSIGYLGRFFGDAFESVDRDVAAGLRAMGASRIQAFQNGLWPYARPLVYSNSLWMLEYNIRSAAIVGYVGAGGIGTQLYAYVEFSQWDRFSAVLLLLFAVVLVLDDLGVRLRRALTE